MPCARCLPKYAIARDNPTCSSVCRLQAEEGAAKVGSIIDKIKDALPFGTLPVFDLADLSKDDADMGPNEVTKEYLGTGFQNSNNPFDTAMPGAPWCMTQLHLCAAGTIGDVAI